MGVLHTLSVCWVQGYLAHKRQCPPRTLQYDYAVGSRYRGTLPVRDSAPQDPTVGLCLGPYGGPEGVGAVSYERGTPVHSRCGGHTWRVSDTAVQREEVCRTLSSRARHLFGEGAWVGHSSMCGGHICSARGCVLDTPLQRGEVC